MITETHPEQKEAPGELELVRGFVNTLDIEQTEEDFATPEQLREWLARRELMDPDEPVTEGDVRRAVDVREGLRALCLRNNGSPFEEARSSARPCGQPGRPAPALPPRRLCGVRARCHRRGRRPGPAAGNRGRGPRRGRVGPPQGLRRRHLPVGLLRQVEEPLEEVVPHGDLRKRRTRPARTASARSQASDQQSSVVSRQGFGSFDGVDLEQVRSSAPARWQARR